MKKMVYSLALFLGSASAILAQSATDKVNHAVARDSKVNQMFITTNSGDVKYYNTADLASVKFEGNKTIVAPKDGSDNDEYDASVREINFAKRLEQGDNGGIENPAGVVKITEAKAWLESAYLKWEPFEGASSYHVYVDGKKIDAQLIRQYASYSSPSITETMRSRAIPRLAFIRTTSPSPAAIRIFFPAAAIASLS